MIHTRRRFLMGTAALALPLPAFAADPALPAWRLAPDGWGTAPAADITSVINSAMMELWRYFPGRRLELPFGQGPVCGFRELRESADEHRQGAAPARVFTQVQFRRRQENILRRGQARCRLSGAGRLAQPCLQAARSQRPAVVVLISGLENRTARVARAHRHCA